MEISKLKYILIYEDLKKRIRKGEFVIGDLIPSEPELGEHYNASRITVRRAVQMLVEDGFLQKNHGVGTIVMSNKESLQLRSLKSFSEEQKNSYYSSKVIRYAIDADATTYIQSMLKVPKESKISFQEKLYYKDDEVIGLQRVNFPNYINFTDQELENEYLSLYKLCEEKGYKVKNAEETIESVVSDNTLSEYFGIPVGSPLLHIKRVTIDSMNRIVEFAEIYYRGDKYQYKVSLESE